MKIVIEVEGEKISVVGPDAVRTAASLVAANAGEMPPAPPPAGLLARAKKLGALSAGAAQFGTGAALAATASAGQPLKLPVPARPKPRRKRVRRSR